MNFVQRIFFGLPFLLVATAASASWKVDAKRDSMTDQTQKSAVVVNSLGHSLSIYRHPNGAAWANFSLSSSSLDQLSPQTPPIYRIDKNPPNDLSNEKRLQEMGLGLQAFAWEPKWVNFLVWHGKESEGRSETLNQLMQGKTVVVRYYLFTGGSKDTTFTLEGAGPAIANALGISVKANTAREAQQTAFKDAYIAATQICQQDMKTFSTCFDKVAACGKQANNNLATFQKCVE